MNAHARLLRPMGLTRSARNGSGACRRRSAAHYLIGDQLSYHSGWQEGAIHSAFQLPLPISINACAHAGNASGDCMKASRNARLLLIAIAAFITTAVAADSSDLSYCTVCTAHTGNGNPAIRAPKISGMESWYLRRQLEAFRDGVRGHAPGCRRPRDAAGGHSLARGSRDRSGDRLRSTFKPKAPPITVAARDARRHPVRARASASSDGEGNKHWARRRSPIAPDWYLVTQLPQTIKRGLRGLITAMTRCSDASPCRDSAGYPAPSTTWSPISIRCASVADSL